MSLHGAWPQGNLQTNYSADVPIGAVPGGYSVGQNAGPVRPGSVGDNTLAHFAPFFGLAPKQAGDYPVRKEVYDLPEAYSGQNAYISTLLMNEITTEDQWPTRELLPYALAEDKMSIQFDQWIFHRHLLDRVPEEMTVKLTTSSKKTRLAYMVRYGLGFLLEHGFFRTAQGIEQYRRNILQIKYATIETACFNVLWEVMSCERYGADSFVQTMRRKLSIKQLKALIKEEIDNYAAIVKAKHGWNNLVTQTTKVLQSRGVTGARYVVLAQGGRTLVANRPENADFLYSGRPTGPTDIISQQGWTLRESRGFVTGENTSNYDPMIRPKSVGEFVHMGFLPHMRGRDEFQTSDMDTQVYDEDEDDFRIIRYMDALEATGLWKDKSHSKLSSLGRAVFAGQTSYLDWFRTAGVLDKVVAAIEAGNVNVPGDEAKRNQAVNDAKAAINKLAGGAPSGANSTSNNAAAVTADIKKLARQLVNDGNSRLGVALVARFLGGQSSNVAFAIVNGLAKGVANIADAEALTSESKVATDKPDNKKVYVESGGNSGSYAFTYDNKIPTNYVNALKKRLGKDETGLLEKILDSDAKIDEKDGWPSDWVRQLAEGTPSRTDKEERNRIDLALRAIDAGPEGNVLVVQDTGAQVQDAVSRFIDATVNRHVSASMLQRGLKIIPRQTLDFVRKHLTRLAKYENLVRMAFANYVIRPMAAANSDRPDAGRVSRFKKWAVVVDIALGQLEEVQQAAIALGDDAGLAKANELDDNFTRVMEAFQYSEAMIKEVVDYIPESLRNAPTALGTLVSRLKDGMAVKYVVDTVKSANGSLENQLRDVVINGYENSFTPNGVAGGGPGSSAIRDRDNDGSVTFLLSRLLIEKEPGFFWDLAKADVPNGLDIILARPHWTHRMGSGFMCVPGASLGNTWIGHAMFFLGDDAKRAMHNGSFWIYIKALLLYNQNIAYMNDCFPVDYVSGGGIDFWDPSKHQSKYQSGDGCQADIFALAVPTGWRSRDHMLDLSGHFDSRIVKNARQEDAHYPTAGAYSSFWGWKYTHEERELHPTYFSVDFFRRLTEQYNMLCMRGYSATKDKDGKFTHVQINKGHWGPNVYPGCGKVRRGRESHFVVPSYIQNRVISVV